MRRSFSIHFYYQGVQFHFSERNKLKSYLQVLFKNEGMKLDTLNYIFCTDEYLLGLNQQYLDHDTLTDIITFYYQAPGEPILSDIYISIDRLRDNAATYQTSFSRELHRVIFHGALHLCGYKDKLPKDQAAMRQMEELHLRNYLVPRGTFREL